MRKRFGVILVVVLALVVSACGSGSPTAPSPTPSSLPVVITPPSAPVLPALSAEARQLILDWNIKWGARPAGGTIRWMQSSPITVWADSNFDPEDIRAVVDFWNSALGGKLTLTKVESEAEANVKLVRHWPPTNPGGIPEGQIDNACSVGGPNGFRGNVVTSGLAEFSFAGSPACNPGVLMRQTIAHEIGHIVIPFGWHPPTRDVMGKRSMTDPLMLEPLTVEIATWINSVPQGTRLE